MKFTTLSHAGLLVETRDCSLLIDPWLVGSCYWRSWWNYPPPQRELIDKVKPDFIYLTHLHWDHFHGISLKRFDPATPILVPRTHFTRMVDDMNGIGFDDVRELPHGKSMRLAGSTVVTSYQFGLMLDSALVIDTGEGVLLNANDCKVMGLPLRQITARHPQIDFVFKSHSSASPYPYCVSSEFPDDLTQRSNLDYLQEFLAFAECVNARYAIPFASNHCFLHRETRQFNPTAVSPLDVKNYFDRNRSGRSECAVMLSGDSWSSDTGFSIAATDYLTNRNEHIAELEQINAKALNEFYEKEDRTEPDWKSFNRYFTGLFAAMPPGFKTLMPARVLFHVFGARTEYWLLDFAARTIMSADADTACDFVLSVNARVLRDCCRKRMFSVFAAGKRVHYHLKTKSALKYFNRFNTVMDMYESDYFPLRKMASRRFISVWARKWREILFYGRAAASMAVTRKMPRPIDFLKPRIRQENPT